MLLLLLLFDLTKIRVDYVLISLKAMFVGINLYFTGIQRTTYNIQRVFHFQFKFHFDFRFQSFVFFLFGFVVVSFLDSLFNCFCLIFVWCCCCCFCCISIIACKLKFCCVFMIFYNAFKGSVSMWNGPSFTFSSSVLFLLLL